MNTIPKIIHYCWFGTNKMSALQLMCLETWKLHLPDYELRLWNEINVDLSHPFINFAYNNKKWAYVSDYVRLKALFDYGGVYLDTDMYFLKKLEDDLLQKECFFGAEDEHKISGGIIGAKRGNLFIKQCMQNYEIQTPADWQLRFSIPRIITNEFNKLIGRKTIYDKIREIDNLIIYPAEYFYPLPFEIDRPFSNKFKNWATEKTVAIHLWDGSWMELSVFQLLRKRKFLEFLKLFFKTFYKKENLNFQFYRKLSSAFVQSLLRKK